MIVRGGGWGESARHANVDQVTWAKEVRQSKQVGVARCEIRRT